MPFTTTCQQIVDGVRLASTLNKPLVVDRVEMLTRIAEEQQRVFVDTSKVARDFFRVRETIVATAPGPNEGRECDLAALARPLDRVLKVAHAVGVTVGSEIHYVDESDVDAEYAPRYTMERSVLREAAVGDWGSPGAATLWVFYTHGPTALDLAGDLTQLVSLPDEWKDLLILPIAAYAVNKDPGRPDAEYARLVAAVGDVRERWFAHVQRRGGEKLSRFEYPEARV